MLLYNHYKFIYKYIGFKLYLWALLLLISLLLEGITFAFFIPFIEIIANNDFFQLPEQLSVLHKIVFYVIDKINIIIIAILIFIFFIIRSIFLVLQSIYSAFLFKKMRMAILDELIKSISYSKYQFYISVPHGNISSLLFSEIDKIILMSNYYIVFIINIAFILVYIIISATIDLTGLIFLLIFVIPFYFIYKKLINIIRINSISSSEANKPLNSHILQYINNFRYLKATGYINIFINKISESNKIKSNYIYKSTIFQNICINMTDPIFITLVCIFIFVQINFFDSNFTELILFLFIIRRIFQNIQSANNNYSLFQMHYGSINIYDKLYQSFLNNNEFNNISNKITPDTKKDIYLNNISFKYEEEINLLNNIDLLIEKNTNIAILGPSGIGKSTLLYIIMGIITPTEGKVFIGDLDYNDMNHLEFRQKISYVDQSNVIFNDSIKNNIYLQSYSIELDCKSNQHNTDNIINTLGLKNIMNNNASNLSGGEKQRVHFIREIIKDSDILILDEVTNNLDNTIKMNIKNMIQNLDNQKTVIIVDHDEEFVDMCDYIYVLDNNGLHLYNN